MNGESNRIPAVDPAVTSSRRFQGTLSKAQFWLLAVFVAMSLVAAAARSVIDGSESPTIAAVLAVAGMALLPIAWRNVALLLERSDGVPSADGARAETAPAAGNLRLALQR